MKIFLSLVALFALSLPVQATAVSRVISRQVVVNRVQVQRVVQRVQVQRVVAVKAVAVKQVFAVQAYPVVAAQVVYPVQALYGYGVASPLVSPVRAPERIIEKLDASGRVVERITER